jgi:hypothetical protein
MIAAFLPPTLFTSLFYELNTKDGLEYDPLDSDVYGFREKEIKSIESLFQWIAASEAESVQFKNQSRYLPISYSRTEDREADLVALLHGAVALAIKMETAAGSSETIELSNAAFELKDKLELLWEFRHGREDDWADLLHMLQCCIFADLEFERLSVLKCVALRMVLELLTVSTVGLGEIAAAEEYLSNAGFDPWAVISLKDSDQN